MYKIIKNDEVIEHQENLNWVKYQPKNNLVMGCSEGEGEAILAGSYVDDPENPGEQIWSSNSVIYRVNFKPSSEHFSGHDMVQAVYVSSVDVNEHQKQQDQDIADAFFEIMVGGE